MMKVINECFESFQRIKEFATLQRLLSYRVFMLSDTSVLKGTFLEIYERRGGVGKESLLSTFITGKTCLPPLKSEM